jgi:hypothetical protein
MLNLPLLGGLEKRCVSGTHHRLFRQLVRNAELAQLLGRLPILEVFPISQRAPCLCVR